MFTFWILRAEREIQDGLLQLLHVPRKASKPLIDVAQAKDPQRASLFSCNFVMAGWLPKDSVMKESRFFGSFISYYNLVKHLFVSFPKPLRAFRVWMSTSAQSNQPQDNNEISTWAWGYGRALYIQPVSASLFGLWAIGWQASPNDMPPCSFESHLFFTSITTLPFLFCLKIDNTPRSGEY